MPNFRNQILGVAQYQSSTDEIDPGSDKSIYITALAYGSTDGGTDQTLTISSGDNIKVRANQTITFNPPIKLAKAATATPGHADLHITYFIAK